MCTQIKAAQHVSVQDNTDAMDNLLNNISLLVFFFISFLKTYYYNVSVLFIFIYRASLHGELLNSDWLLYFT